MTQTSEGMLRLRPREVKQVLRDTQQADSKCELSIRIVLLGPGASSCVPFLGFAVNDQPGRPNCSRGPVPDFENCIRLVRNLIALAEYLTKSNLRKERSILAHSLRAAHSLRVQAVMREVKAQGEGAGHIVSTLGKQS